MVHNSITNGLYKMLQKMHYKLTTHSNAANYLYIVWL